MALTVPALADDCFHLLARLADIYAQMTQTKVEKVDSGDTARKRFVMFCIVRT